MRSTTPSSMPTPASTSSGRCDGPCRHGPVACDVPGLPGAHALPERLVLRTWSRRLESVLLRRARAGLHQGIRVSHVASTADERFRGDGAGCYFFRRPFGFASTGLARVAGSLSWTSPESRARASNPSSAAYSSKVSSVTFRSPRSNAARYRGVTPIRSASCSCVMPQCRRCARSPSPSRRFSVFPTNQGFRQERDRTRHRSVPIALESTGRRAEQMLISRDGSHRPVASPAPEDSSPERPGLQATSLTSKK